MTALRPRGRTRVAVELDGAPWRVLPLEAVAQAGLSAGCALDRPRARALARALRRADAQARALRALVHRDRSTHELDDRLAAGGVDPATREAVVESLERTGLVDDGRFARSRAAALAGRGWGDAAIRTELERHALDREQVEDALAGLEGEAERAARIAARRGGGRRTAAYLAARGFDPDLVESFVADEAGGQ